MAFSSLGCVPEGSRTDSGGSGGPPGPDFRRILRYFFAGSAGILSGFVGFRRDVAGMHHRPPELTLRSEDSPRADNHKRVSRVQYYLFRCSCIHRTSGHDGALQPTQGGSASRTSCCRLLCNTRCRARSRSRNFATLFCGFRRDVAGIRSQSQ